MTTARRKVAASAQQVFQTLVDVPGLPTWNRALTQVLEVPREMTPGAEWVVEVSAMGQRWPSRSRLVEIDPAARVFAYRSCTDDGNPSYALWRWEVTDDGVGATVTVSWELHPATFWRRVLLAKIRQRQLGRTEVPQSLAALAEASERAAARG